MTLSQWARSPVSRASGTRPNVFVYALALCLLGALAFRSNWGALVSDTKPELYLDPTGTLRGALSALAPDPYLGSPNFNGGILPVAAVVSALHFFVEPAWLLQRLLKVALGLLAFVGAGRAARAVGVNERLGWVVAATVYVLGPFAMVAGSTLPIAIPHAVLPWLLVSVGRALRPTWSSRDLAAAVAFFGAMTGINAGSVSLMLLLPVVVVTVAALMAARGARRSVFVRAVVLAVGFGAISAYWLAPALLARGSGQAIVGTTESMNAIAATSSWSEVVRGLGLWPMYGGDSGGPWQPGFSAYATNPLVIAVTVVPLILAAIGTARLGRRACIPAVLIAVGGSFMVGLHPIEASSPFGRVLAQSFEAFPPLLVLRTTVKSGSTVALATAVLAGAGVVAVHAAIAHRSRNGGRFWQCRVSVVALTAGGLVVTTLAYPAVAGTANPETMEIPSYWKAAANSLNQQPPDRGTWFLPGTDQTAYRWGYSGPDDVLVGLIKGRTVRRSTVPNSTPAATDFLAGVDNSLARGDAPEDLVSSAATYLGVGRVVLRADIDTTTTGGISPGSLQRQLDSDPGLLRVAKFGQYPSAWADPRDTTAPEAALLVYDVRSASHRPTLRSATGTTTLVGDPSSLPFLLRAGLLPTDRAIHLASTLDGKGLTRLIRQGTRIEITDGAEQRGVSVGRIGVPTTPLLTATEAPFSPRTVSDRTDDHTVRAYTGADGVGATSNGSVFGPTAHDSPAAAVDGDDRTAWIAGDFGNAVGQRWWVDLDQPHPISKVRLTLAQTTPVQIAGLRISAGTAQRDVNVSAGATHVEIDLGGGRADRLTVEVTRTYGDGINGVGLAEVAIVGVAVIPRVRTPLTLDSLSSDLSQPDHELLALTPLDVVLRRYQGLSGVDTDDEEKSLRRTVTLPDQRTFLPIATIRAGGIADTVADRLAGTEWDVRATASSRRNASPLSRPSLVLDVDEGTAWEPASGTSDWLELDLGSRRDVSSVNIKQTGSDGLITKVEVSLDGRVVGTYDLEDRVQSIKVPTQSARTVRLTVVATDSPNRQVGISSLSVQGVTPVPRSLRSNCLEIATWDGVPVRVGIKNVEAFFRSGFAQTIPCAQQRTLATGPGVHELNTTAGLTVDYLTLYDAQHVPAAPDRDLGTSVQWRDHGMTLRLGIPDRTAPTTLSLGLADLGWTAVADGIHLTAINGVDGYAAGWFVPEGKATTLTIRYPHVGLLIAAQWFSAGAALIVLFVWMLGRGGSARCQGAAASQGESTHNLRGAACARSGGKRRSWLTCGLVMVAALTTCPWSLLILIPILLTTVRRAGCGIRRPDEAVAPRLAAAAAVLAFALPFVIWAVRGGWPSVPSFDLIRGDTVSPVLAATWAWLLVLAASLGSPSVQGGLTPDTVRHHE